MEDTSSAKGGRDTRASWRVVLGNVVFDNDTRAGQLFDLALIVLIFGSVLTVMLESVSAVRAQFGPQLRAAEAAFTLLFCADYLLRLIAARRAWHYARSFFGVVDLLSILPGFAALLFPGTQALSVVRVLRLLRMFRILKLARYLREASVLSEALRASTAKITVFVAVVLTLVTIIGSLMYVIEGPQHGFTSIPTSIYWAIVTLTTVGYGDIAPQTGLGKFLASAAMILGYGIIAVPTGIVTVGLTQVQARRNAARTCQNCGLSGHEADALHCKRCGAPLPTTPSGETTPK